MSANLEFVKALFKTVVEGNREMDVECYNSTELSFYQSLSDEQKNVFMSMLEQIRIDTISEILGIIDGSSTLIGCSLEPKLLLDSVDTGSELQDTFLEFIEEKENDN